TGRMRQTFLANEISVSDPGEPLTLSFAAIHPVDGMTHSLILMKDHEEKGPKSIYMEFNDQINACWGPSLRSVELGEDFLTIRLDPAARLKQGKVDALTDDPLSELVVNFAVPPELLLRMDAALDGLLREGCGLTR